MRIGFNIRSNLDFDGAGEKVKAAAEKGLRDIIVRVARDSIKGSPYLTGHNRRSIAYEIKGLTGLVYSSSGYGGFLETGTSRMVARPYMKPALDKNIGDLGKSVEEHL